MGYIHFDFGGSYNDNAFSRAQYLKQNIEKYFDDFDVSYDDFIDLLYSHTIGFYVSSSNTRRQAKNLETQAVISNFFFRPKWDKYGEGNIKKNFLIKGDIVLKNDKYNKNRSFIRVRDIFLFDINIPKDKEYYCDCDQIDYCNLEKKFELWNDEDNLISSSFQAKVPYIVEPESLRCFVDNWKRYLEFEKSITIRNMKSYPILSNIDFKTVVEVPDNASNRDNFENYIEKEGVGKIYIDSKCPSLSETSLVDGTLELLTIKVARKEFYDKNEIVQFAKSIPSIIDEENNKRLEKLVSELKKTDEQRRQEGIEFSEVVGLEIDDFCSPVIEEKTISFYFLVANETRGKVSYIKKYIDNSKGKLFLAYIASGDVALYKRGKNALEKIESGDVKNPFLAGILLNPQMYELKNEKYSLDNIEFALKNLNQSQKESIVKCLNSESIFCLQGPPGTGKTQTITELVYQYNKMGKKVLLSSQTHIAIDNVIERLPKELNILPIRLVRDRSKANEQYLPDHLLDNLYDSAYFKYTGKIEEYEKYEKKVSQLEQRNEIHKKIFENIEKRLTDVKNKEKELSNLMVTLSQLRSEESDLKSDSMLLEKKLIFFNEFKRTGLSFEVVKDNMYFDEVVPQLEMLRKKYNPKNVAEQENFYNYIISFKKIAGKNRIEHLENLLQFKEKPSDLQEIEDEINQLKLSIETCKNHNLDYSQLKGKLQEKLMKKKELDRKYENCNIINIKQEPLYFVKSLNNNAKEIIEKELEIIRQFVSEYNVLLRNTLNTVRYDELNNRNKIKIQELEKKIKEIKHVEISVDNLRKEIQEQDNPIKHDRTKLEEYFNSFYQNELNGASLPETEVKKFQEIETYIQQEKQKFQMYKLQYQKKMPLYEVLSNYLRDRKSFVTQQRPKFTKTLLKNNANVYGITCSSNSKFRSETLSGAKSKKNIDSFNLELDDVDLNKIDFDVVIIDEVSKATPIELLIPMVYGKSVILVGDQRQLPPIFKYRESMFDGFDEETKIDIMQGKSLEEYKSMVERSLFEEIFNNLRYNKTMLTQQYRFNEQIMNCVNVFYEGKLQLGAGTEQNNKKQHYLDVSIKNHKGGEIPIFCRNNWTYWFDSHLWPDGSVAYAELREGETSLRNPLEVKITVELLLLLEKGYGELKNNNPEEYKMAAGDGSRPSVAVISMYGKHINSIKNELANRKIKIKEFKNISLDISTVDNYQGKEQDIVLVNMVANNKAGMPGEFLKKFNRINVAISRARTMLIMVGSRTFYNKVSINVPKMENGIENKINAYYQIYAKCESKWNSTASIFNIQK